MELKAGKPCPRIAALMSMALLTSFALLALSGTTSSAFAKGSPTGQVPIDPGDGGGANEGGVAPWVEYSKHIKAAQNLAPLQNSFAGENVNPYDGATTFSVTDINVPGNSALPVRLARRLDIALQPQDMVYPYDSLLHGVGNWTVDVPYMAATYASSAGWIAQRCSRGSVPPLSIGPNGAFYREDVWQGIAVHVPGRGNITALGVDAQVPVPTDGETYGLTTKQRDVFDCIPMQSGLPGEGFRMTTTSGISYYFDVGTTRTASKLVSSIKYYSDDPIWHPVYLARTRYYLLASKIEDRYGNTVQFQYDANGHPTRIWSSDGREITLSYSNGRLTSATSNGRTWRYQYNAEGKLTDVVMPDDSRWQYAYTGTLKPPTPTHSLTLPWCRVAPAGVSATFSLTTTHPSGAVATFHFDNLRHYRSGVHATECAHSLDGGYHLLVPYYFDVMSLIRKTISGPGLSDATWTYDYGDYDGKLMQLWGTHTEPPDYPCTTCMPYKTVTVTRPDGTQKRSRYGIVYRLNEGRLMRTQTLDASSHVVRSKAYQYMTETEAADQPFYGKYGHVLGGFDPTTARIRPVTRTVMTQDGETFTTTTNAFDTFARAASRTESNSLGYNRAVQTAYHDQTSLWVLGQTAKVTVNGTEIARTTYNSMAQPVKSYRFGKPVSTRAWNAGGTLRSVADGIGNTTSFDDWYRGLPRKVTFADGTSKSATVNGAGWITSLTDQTGQTTHYAYDGAGRLTRITYPADGVAWYPTTFTYQYVTDAERGIAGGHWRRTVSQGNARHMTWYDAMWRPLLTDTWISGDSGSHISTLTTWNWKGLATFRSWPTAGSLSMGANASGISTTYDTLGRITSVSQPSELGTLTTTTAYLSNARKRVTGPEGHVTTLSYQVFGRPHYDTLVQVQAPEGITQAITRDAFGAPTAITQSGPDGLGGSVSQTKRYFYDTYHRLCRTFEPETGSTVFAYDAASNLIASAEGQNVNGSGCGTMPQNHVVRTYDALNRLTAVSYPDGSGDITFTYDALGHVRTSRAQYALATANWTYQHDSQGHLIHETLAVDGYSWPVHYAYDRYGSLSGITYPDGTQVTYAPDALGRPTRAGSRASSVSYFPDGGIKYFVLGNGTEYLVERNTRNLIKNLTYADGNTLVYSLDRAYDKAANVIQLTDLTQSGQRSETLSYDALNRLTKARADALWGITTYDYDGLNNLRSIVRGGMTRTYAYNARNRLTATTNGSATLHHFSYDAQGNVIQKDARTRIFNRAHRLLKIPGVARYAYDAAGRRVKKTAADGTTTYYAYGNGGHLLMTYKPGQGQAEQARYVYLGKRMIAQVKHQIIIAPGTAPGLTVPANNDTGDYVVNWNNVSGATSYTLQQRVDSGSWTDAYNGSSAQKSYHDKDGGVYGYRVRACNAAGCGPWSAAASIVVDLPTPPPPTQSPSIQAPDSNQTGSYTVSWTTESGASYYVLKEKTGSGSWATRSSSQATSWHVDGHADGQYSYKVQACNAGGCGPWSSIATVTITHPAPPTSAPALSLPSNNATGSYSVTWTSVAHADRYILQERVNQGGWATQLNKSVTHWSTSGRGDGSYSYRARACNGDGCGPWSGTAKVVVTIPVPLAIDGETYRSTYLIPLRRWGTAAIGFDIVGGHTWEVFTTEPGVGKGHVVVASGAVPASATRVRYTWTRTSPTGTGWDARGSVRNDADSKVAVSSNPFSKYTTERFNAHSGSHNRTYQLKVEFFNAAGANVSTSTCTLMAGTEGAG